jgi:hypothetical protein
MDDPAALAAALAGRSTEVRGPVESGEGRVVVTPSGLLDGVAATSDVPLDIVLLTEVDLFFTPGMRGEPGLAATSDLFALTAGPLSVLRMHASGDGSHAIVPEPATATLEPPPPAEPPPPGPTLWSPPNVYHVQAGDYLVKIAATYLGDGARWPEIWALNKQRFPGRSPDELFVGDTLVMPPEAVPPFVVPPVQPQQGPSLPTVEPGPWMNVDVEDIADALARQDFGVVFDFLASIPPQPPPPPPAAPAFGFGAEEALFLANITTLALKGEVDHPPGDEPQP